LSGSVVITARKEIIGEALVKVNLGFAQPDDLRRAAIFLKGSGFIAKAEVLNELIQYLHDDSDYDPNAGMETESLLGNDAVPLNKTITQNLEEFDEDSEVTHREHVDDIDS